MTEHVKTEIAAGIMTLTLTRPDKMNALSNAMYSAMSDALERAEKDPAVRVVLFQGDGDNFTAGNDLADFSAQANGKDTSESQAHRFIGNLGKATRPLIAAVQGNAVGVGTTMLLHCDLVFLANTAKLMTPFVNLALVPEAASSWLLPARIGHVRAYAMFALGEPLDAATALACGLANAVVPAQELRAKARQAAEALTKRPAGSLDARHGQDRRSDRAGRRIISRTLADRRGARSLRCLCRAPQAGFFQGRGINRRSLSNERLARVAPRHRTGRGRQVLFGWLAPVVDLHRRSHMLFIIQRSSAGYWQVPGRGGVCETRDISIRRPGKDRSGP